MEEDEAVKKHKSSVKRRKQAVSPTMEQNDGSVRQKEKTDTKAMGNDVSSGSDTDSDSTVTNNSSDSSPDQTHRERFSTQLACLMAQSPFLPVIKLETENPVWRRIMDSLPEEHLSFPLEVGTDTLPTLQQRSPEVDSNCPLCMKAVPIPNRILYHILSHCSRAASERYTWRHDCALKIIVNGLMDYLKPEDKLFADLPGLTASDDPQPQSRWGIS